MRDRPRGRRWRWCRASFSTSPAPGRSSASWASTSLAIWARADRLDAHAASLRGADALAGRARAASKVDAKGSEEMLTLRAADRPLRHRSRLQRARHRPLAARTNPTNPARRLPQPRREAEPLKGLRHRPAQGPRLIFFDRLSRPSATCSRGERLQRCVSSNDPALPRPESNAGPRPCRRVGALPVPERDAPHRPSPARPQEDQRAALWTRKSAVGIVPAIAVARAQAEAVGP